MRKKHLSDESDRSDNSDLSDSYGLKSASAEVAANTMICLTNQAGYLLGRQLQALEQAFLKEGGFTERLYRERSRARKADLLDLSHRSDRSDKEKP